MYEKVQDVGSWVAEVVYQECGSASQAEFRWSSDAWRDSAVAMGDFLNDLKEWLVHFFQHLVEWLSSFFG